MKRYLDPEKFDRFLADFDFLFDKIRKSDAELDLKLRDNYFNIYYKGNSLAEISFLKDKYGIKIHREFADGVLDKPCNTGKDYWYYSVDKTKLRSFLQSKHINGLKGRIAKRNYGEEITFEQILMTDNVNRQDLLIIDRQVTEPDLKMKMDLLALKQIDGKRYRFVIIEVKLGKNKELSEKVGSQLDNYVNHLRHNFSEWKKSYEMAYYQMKKTKIFDKPSYDNIEILEGVEGVVIVGFYSQVAEKQIQMLRSKHPDICVKLLNNKIDLT